MHTFLSIPVPGDRMLTVSKETEDMILYDSFMMFNPETSTDFPPSDEPYYTSLEYQLRHLLFKYEKGWITSERQVMVSSDECISNVHFIFDENNKVKQINVFQRSSNLLNLEDDVMFFNYFINKYLDSEKVDLNILNSMPHIFKNRKKKIND